MRIQVVFNSTPILVPCGDGKLTVGELIQKAIVRFKKLGNKVSGRVCGQRRACLGQLHGGSNIHCTCMVVFIASARS